MFPHATFKAANPQERTPIEVAKELSKRYRNLIMVAGSDRVASFEKLLNQYNGIEYHYDTIQVVSAGERDPDADDASGMSGTKMRALALAGNFPEFKKGLPRSLHDDDARKLLNDIRVGMGADAVREQYVQGNIFNVGDLVESDDIIYKIIMRGANYLFLEDSHGTKTKKWLQDVTAIDTDENMNEKEILYTSADKIKVARIIAGALGADTSKSSPEELINMALRKIRNKPMHSEYIDTIKNMLATADQAGIKYDKKLISSKIDEAAKARNVFTLGKAGKSDNDADDKGGKSDYDSDDIPTNDSDFDTTKDDKHGSRTREGSGIEPDENKDYLRRQKIKYKKEAVESESDDDGEHEDESDDDIDGMVDGVNDFEDIFHAYDDEELHIVDDETGEHVDDLHEEYITEVLSRIERMRAKVRFARSSSTRERKLRVALRTSSSPTKINHRARVMAVHMMKLKLARKPMNKLSIQEKERIERIISRKGKVLSRIAMKLVPRIKSIESARLHPASHH
jgi:DNA-binding phage protein